MGAVCDPYFSMPIHLTDYMMSNPEDRALNTHRHESLKST
jgi:hypothetical protein